MFLFLDAFTYLKDVFGGLLRLAPDALHVHVGIAIFFAVALMVRGPRAFVTAFWVVLGVAVVTEVFDLLYDLEVGRPLRWLNSVKDIVNAVVWPAAWMVFGARFGRLIRPQDAPPTPARGGESGVWADQSSSRSSSRGEPVAAVTLPSRMSALESAAEPHRTQRLGGVAGVRK
jgi:hypothetical protein